MKTTLFLLLLAIFAFNCKKDNAKPAQAIDVTDIEVTSISIKTTPTKADYFIDEELNLSGLTVALTMSDGSTKDFSYPDFESNGLTSSPVNGAKANETNKTITITHTSSGKSISFDIVIDKFKDTRDGQVYKFVKIGNQVWMAENLKYLPSVVGPASVSMTTPYYYVYGYNGTNVTEAKATANYATYGVLYNWPAAMNGAASSTANPSGVQGICPVGWHLPSDAEWTQLITYLGGESIAGDKLKETGTTNETGFTAIPGGVCDRSYSTFLYIGYYYCWWSATVSDTDEAWSQNMYSNYRGVYRYSDYKDYGLSVRCIRD
jgi:uncharacterized protein (TIGR02145 family)